VVLLIIYSIRMWCLLRKMKGLSQNMASLVLKIMFSLVILIGSIYSAVLKNILFSWPKSLLLDETFVEAISKYIYAVAFTNVLTALNYCMLTIYLWKLLDI
jgi:hypothetical protein